MRNRSTLISCLVAVLLLVAGACSQPTSPSSAAPPSTSAGSSAPLATISGTVWLHAPDGVRPFANAKLFGWVEFGNTGGTTGAVAIDANGGYTFAVPHGARVRIYAGSGGANVIYQPCEINANMMGDVRRDVRVITDASPLGARLPPEMLQDKPTLSGVVVEVDGRGQRVPLKDVHVELDGLSGLGLPTASTLTDGDGRYVLCGLQGETSTYAYASKTGYHLFEAETALNGDTTLDIELQRQ